MGGLTLDAVYEYADGVCFKTGAPGMVGAETEWLVVDRGNPAGHISPDRVRALMGAAESLPARSRLTFEPGGQLELSSEPRQGPAAACGALGTDLAYTRERLAAGGLALSGYGVDPYRRPRLQETGERYRCMAAYFGTSGLAMMCTTASVQVCLDVGADRADAARRWRLAHALGPVLVAAFANSPLQSGRLTGLRSTRQAIWAGLDPGRTLPVRSDVAVAAGGAVVGGASAAGGGGGGGGAVDGEDPGGAWARYALDARVMLMRHPLGGWIENPGMTFREWIARGEPTLEDFRYHLTTLFPPVRPRGWLELRMIDALPDPYWPVPVAVAAALFDDPQAAEAAREVAEPAAGRWAEAARDALADPTLARAARNCFSAAHAALLRQDATALARLVADYAERYVERGRCPADELIDPPLRTPDPTEEDLAWLSRN